MMRPVRATRAKKETNTPMTAPILYLDTETNRLRRPYVGGGRRAWELAGTRVDSDGTEHDLRMFIRIADLGFAAMLPHGVASDSVMADELLDPSGNWYRHLPGDVLASLDIGGFHQRHPERTGVYSGNLFSAREAARRLVDGPWLRTELIGGQQVAPTLVGAVPGFEDLGLFDLLYRQGVIGPDDQLWHYHLLDAETYAAGALGWEPPYRSDVLTAALGVTTDDLVKHSAYDDAVWARRLYEAARDRRKTEVS